MSVREEFNADRSSDVTGRVGWRSYVVLLLIAAVLLVARGVAVSSAQSERFDDEYHLSRGVAFLRRSIGGRSLNDPPLGEAISAIPLWATRSVPADPATDMGIWGHRLSPETLLELIAVWKSLLFLPFLAVAFAWASQLYGPRAGWLTAALLLIEPTFAAHTPLPSIDVLAVEGIVLACYTLARYVRRPTLGWLVALCVAMAVAMLLKHTAVILPGVAVIVAAALWWGGPQGERPAVARVAGHVLLATCLLPLTIWALTLFDVSTPVSATVVNGPAWIRRILSVPWPAGTYLRAFAQGAMHAKEGHGGFLNGETREHGWWYYYPVVASYKLPLGIGAILAAGLASFAWQRPRRDEWPLLIPAILWVAFLFNNSVNIGFRHFLPALAFLVIIGSRVAATRSRAALVAISAAVLVAMVEVGAAHPNYLSYVNVARSRSKPYLAITDSNLDWGQALIQLADWSKRQPPERPIRFAYFGNPDPVLLDHYLGATRVEVVIKPFQAMPATLPTDGLFVVSPSCLVGGDALRPLWALDPVARIGDALLVYDLDAIGGRLQWHAATR